jgi:circadian clock protein KaiC
VLGASGSGKTSLGLHFLSRSSAQGPGLLFGFHEMPLRLRLKAARIGIRLDSLIDEGHLETSGTRLQRTSSTRFGNRLL